jgi:hypothetical protein
MMLVRVPLYAAKGTVYAAKGTVYAAKGTSRERLLDIAPLPSSAHIESPGRYSTGIQLPRGTPTAVTARRVGDQKRKPIG